eukprot:COSAG01_NODE_20385_length_957_cov_0.932401_2_plen_194_part_01
MDIAHRYTEPHLFEKAEEEIRDLRTSILENELLHGSGDVDLKSAMYRSSSKSFSSAPSVAAAGSFLSQVPNATVDRVDAVTGRRVARRWVAKKQQRPRAGVIQKHRTTGRCYCPRCTAATRIQTSWRAFMARTVSSRVRRRQQAGGAAATTIQSGVRGWLARRRVTRGGAGCARTATPREEEEEEEEEKEEKEE